MLACFIPGFLSDIVRILVGALLLLGGASLLIQLFLHKDKAALWLRVPGILRQLTAACAIVYLMAFLLGLVTLIPALTTNTITAVLLLINGAALFWLAWCIEAVTRQYPKKPQAGQVGGRTVLFQSAPLSLTLALLIFLGVLLALLAVLLVPVSLGMLPFSPDGQLGLLIVIMAIRSLPWARLLSDSSGARCSWLPLACSSWRWAYIPVSYRESLPISFVSCSGSST